MATKGFPTQKIHDPYFKKIIPYHQPGAHLNFRVSQDLFSSFDIDVGTRFLLRTLADQPWERYQSILDLGCGYGPIGLTLQKLAPHARVHMLDRDALAVAYTRQNADLNNLPDVTVYGALGYDDLQRPTFDLIVSNIPAKVGDAAISYLLRDAQYHLEPGGLVVVVVVARLEASVSALLAATPNIKIVLQQARLGHTVFHYQFTEQSQEPASTQSALERGVYQCETLTFPFGAARMRLQTAFGLAESDAPNHPTEFLLEGLAGLKHTKPRRVVAFNPGQGYGAVAAWSLLHPEQIALVDRDLLALRYTRNNLLQNGCADDQISLAHQVGIATQNQSRADLIVGVLREDEGQAAIALTLEDAADQLAPSGVVVLAGSSTAISRIISLQRSQKLFKVEERKRREGDSLLILKSAR